MITLNRVICNLHSVAYDKIKKSYKLILFVYVSIAFGINIAGADSVSPSDVFNRMINTYEKLSHYSDKGVRTTYYYKGEKLHTKDTQKFETHFNYPENFSFKWASYKYGLKPQYNSLESNNGEIYLNIWEQEPTKYNNLNKAISSITGITGRSAYWLPRIIIKNIFCPDFSGVQKKHIGTEMLFGQRNYVIEITYKGSGESESLWINQDNHTLTKIQSESLIGPYKVIDEIIYKDIKLH